MSNKSIKGIKAIAREAGVAISTVSCALNNTGNLSQATRERILAIAKRHNYQPSFLAKSLKRKQTGVMGLLLSSFGGEFFSELIEGIQAGLEKAGLELVICHGYRSQRVLSEGLFDGMIILDAQVTDDLILSFLEMGKKIVVLDRKFTHLAVGEVLLDNYHGCSLIWSEIRRIDTNHLYCITGPIDNYDSMERKNSILELSKSYSKIQLDWHIGDFTRRSGYLSAQKILSKHANRWDEPAVIFAFNDNMAWGVYDYAKEMGLTIGKDFFLAGFDNLELNSYLQPSLRSIGYNRREWGMKASEQLVTLLSDQPATLEYIETYLSSGGSLG